MDQKTKNNFAPGSMVTFRTWLHARKLSSYLERTKLRSTCDKVAFSHKCRGERWRFV